MEEPMDNLQRAVDAQAPVAQLVITLTKGGQVHVSGPLPNELLCLRMLANAANAVMEFQKKKPAVEIPRLVLPNDLGPRNGN